MNGMFTDDGLTLFGLPVQSIHYKPQMARGKLKQTILQTLYAPLLQYIQHTEAGDVLFFPVK